MSDSNRESACSYIEALSCLFVLMLLAISGSSLAAMMQRRISMHALIQEVRDWRPSISPMVHGNDQKAIESILDAELQGVLQDQRLELEAIDGSMLVQVLRMYLNPETGILANRDYKQIRRYKTGAESSLRPDRLEQYLNNEIDVMMSKELILSSPISIHPRRYFERRLFIAIQLCSGSHHWIPFNGLQDRTHCVERLYPIRGFGGH